MRYRALVVIEVVVVIAKQIVASKGGKHSLLATRVSSKVRQP